jgi:hypothetical protein
VPTYRALEQLTYGQIDVTYGDLESPDDGPDGGTVAGLTGTTVGQLDVSISKIGSGTVSDLLDLSCPGNPEALRYRAARRLSHSAFSCGHVFYFQRWDLIERAFAVWRGNRTFDEAWEELVAAFLIDATSSALQVRPRLSELYEILRRELRRRIEVELLGRTSDSGDVAERMKQVAQPPDAAELLEDAEARVDLYTLLGRLNAEDERLLWDYYDPGADRDELAANYHIKPATLRKRVERALDKVTK